MNELRCTLGTVPAWFWPQRKLNYECRSSFVVTSPLPVNIYDPWQIGKPFNRERPDHRRPPFGRFPIFTHIIHTWLADNRSFVDHLCERDFGLTTTTTSTTDDWRWWPVLRTEGWLPCSDKCVYCVCVTDAMELFPRQTAVIIVGKPGDRD